MKYLGTVYTYTRLLTNVEISDFIHIKVSFILVQPGVYILQMTHILFPGRADPAAKIFAIEETQPPLINVFYCILRSLWSQNLEKYVKFFEK